jgi:hypothetical protein
VNKYPHQNPLTLFSARLDQGAEVFMQKMFAYLKSRAREGVAGNKAADQAMATRPRSRMEKMGRA